MKAIIAATICSCFSQAAPESAPKLMNDLPTFYGLTENADHLSLLNEVYRKTEMKFKAEQSRDATILMPANEAFDILDIRQLTYPQMMQILNYHNLPEVVKFGELDAGDYTFESVEGSHVNLTVTEKDSKKIFHLNQEARVLGSMLETPMGVAYVISRFLVPEDMVDTIKHLPKKEAGHGNSAAAPLETLDVPKHVQESNRANDRYDENPAAADHVSSATVEAAPVADAQGVLTRRAQEVPHVKSGVLPFKPARARTDQREHTFRVLQRGKQRAFMPRTSVQTAARKLKKTSAAPKSTGGRPAMALSETGRGRGNLAL